MENELIVPNYHVIVVHLPLGLLVAGTFIELLAFFWRRTSFRQAGRWMLLIGAMSAIPAATTGLYAARQALSDEQYTSWSGLQNSEKFTSDGQWHALRDHITWNAVAIGVFAFLVVTWLGSSDRFRRNLHVVFLLILLFGMAVLTAAAWHGGELVFRYGTGVMQQRAAVAPTTVPAAPSTSPATVPVAQVSVGVTREEVRHGIERVAPPMQMHLMMAGWVVAMSLAALGLSIRQITMAPDPLGDEARVDEELADALQPGRALSDAPNFNVSKARSSLLAEVEPTPVLVPPARFWMVTLLLGLATAGIGYYIVDLYKLDDYLEFLKNSRRAMAHALLGSSIIVLTLLLAMVTRWAPRSKGAVLLFGLFLLCVLAAQVWVGILMFFDGNEGSWQRFN